MTLDHYATWALVHQCIREDYKTADKLYCRSLTLDPYDENTQVNYDNFVHEFRKGGIYDRAGPPIAIKKNCTLKREETIDGQHWQLFQNPEAILKAHRTFGIAFQLHVQDGCRRNGSHVDSCQPSFKL